MDAYSDSRRALLIAADESLGPCPVDAVLSATLTRAEGRAFDYFVATAPSGHYSQSRAFVPVATAGKSFTPFYFLAWRGRRVIGAGVVLRACLGEIPLPWAEVAHGPVTARPADLPEVLAALRRCCHRKGIARLSVRPYWAAEQHRNGEKFLEEAGFAEVERGADRHSRTLRLDLTAHDSKNPWNDSGFEAALGRAISAGATVRPGELRDIAAFRDLYAAQCTAEGRKRPAAAWYRAVGDYFLAPGAAMFVTELEGVAISAIFITLNNGLATYALGASSDHALPFSKTVLALTEALSWARHAGAHTFDAGGYRTAISMEGELHPERTTNTGSKYSHSRTEVLLTREHVRWL